LAFEKHFINGHTRMCLRKGTKVLGGGSPRFWVSYLSTKALRAEPPEELSRTNCISLNEKQVGTLASHPTLFCAVASRLKQKSSANGSHGN